MPFPARGSLVNRRHRVSERLAGLARNNKSGPAQSGYVAHTSHDCLSLQRAFAARGAGRVDIELDRREPPGGQSKDLVALTLMAVGTPMLLMRACD
jgi:hypothetical protein